MLVPLAPVHGTLGTMVGDHCSKPTKCQWVAQLPCTVGACETSRFTTWYFICPKYSNREDILDKYLNISFKSPSAELVVCYCCPKTWLDVTDWSKIHRTRRRRLRGVSGNGLDVIVRNSRGWLADLELEKYDSRPFEFAPLVGKHPSCLLVPDRFCKYFRLVIRSIIEFSLNRSPLL